MCVSTKSVKVLLFHVHGHSTYNIKSITNHQAILLPSCPSLSVIYSPFIFANASLPLGAIYAH